MLGLEGVTGGVGGAEDRAASFLQEEHLVPDPPEQDNGLQPRNL